MKLHSLKKRIIKRIRTEQSGFVLVTTLLLLALLVGMFVVTTTILLVESRTTQQVQTTAQARQHALAAMHVAIGELQAELGPDQRVSMTADQRTVDGSDGSETSSAVGNRQWTGVFESWPASSEARPTPVFRSWLVSGDASELSRPDAPETELTGPDVVELVSEGTLGPASETGKVKARLVERAVDGVTNGRMAWWIGDQGVKAAVRTHLPSNETSLGVLRNNLQGAPRNAIEVANVGSGKPFSGVVVDDPRLPRVTSWQQAVSFLATDITSPQPLFHDLAGSSTGLLTNVRKGGFRKDLSMKFETYTAAPDLSVPDNILYTARSSMTGNDEVGINFMELWSYYHLYKELRYDGGLNYTTGGVLPSNAPYLQTGRTQTEIVNDPWDRFKHPITINYQTIYSFEADPHPTEDGKYILWLNFDPVVTLWNPLDVPVTVPRHAEGRQWNYLYSFWMIPYDIMVSINGGPEIRCSILKTSNRKNDGNFLKLNAGVAETLTLKPGEVVKISQDRDLSSNQRGQSVGGWEGFNGKKGFNYGGGARVPLLTEDSSLGGTSVDDLEHVVVAPSDTISYRITPRERSESGNSGKFALTHVWLNLGGRGGSLQSFMSVDSRVGYSRVQVGEKRRYGQYWGPNPLDLRADEHPEVFPELEGLSDTRDLPVFALINDKAPFMVHCYHAKTEEENLSGSRMLARFNPRAYSLNFYDLSKMERDMTPFESKLIGLTSWLSAPLDESFSGQGYFGSSLGAEFGSSFVTTHSVPRQPPVSLGALQHSFANGFNMATTGMPCWDGRKPDHTNRLYPLEPQISHAIGNSLAPSVIPSDRTTLNVPNYPHPLADHSYLANRELWDDYFLSGIAPQPTPAFSQEKDQKTVAQEFFEGDEMLPVSRYRPALDGREPGDLVNSFFSGVIPNQDAITDVASYLRVDGLFNVNSTSIEAWKVMLSSLKDRKIVVRNTIGTESIAPADSNTPVANLTAPLDMITSDDAALDAEQWYGRRALTEDEIDGLARAIVKEVRKRGPFLSLADFVNRRVGTDTDLARAGAIQSALDSDDVTINKNQNTGRSVSETVADRFLFPDGEKGAMNYGAPSYVKQGDILTPIAPVLSARSDSFIIRSYGETVENDGRVTARAWCEAIVERDRNFVDPSDPAETVSADLQQEVNKKFGRRFNVVSFRWLDPDEI